MFIHLASMCMQNDGGLNKLLLHSQNKEGMKMKEKSMTSTKVLNLLLYRGYCDHLQIFILQLLAQQHWKHKVCNLKRSSIVPACVLFFCVYPFQINIQNTELQMQYIYITIECLQHFLYYIKHFHVYSFFRKNAWISPHHLQ